MLTITHFDYIRDLYFSKGKTFSQIREITGRNYRTIKKYVMQEDFNESTHHVHRPKRSEVLRPIIHQWLQEDKARPPKQRHTATRIYHRLREEHSDLLEVSRRMVSNIVREEKRKVFGGTEAYLCLDHPGGEAQVDFGHLWAYEQGVYTKFCHLVLSFPKSNAGFAVLTRSETREALLEGLIQLFRFIGYVPSNLWFDQMSTAALRSREMEREAEFFFLSSEEENVIDAAKKAYASPVPEVRMYAVFLLGHCSLNPAVRTFMRKEVSKDPHWRVQEVLAKAFDRFCAINGMEKSLPVIDEWLQDENPNTRRAVTEELRIWTSRDYFKEHPEQAVKRIASLRNDSGESVRKSAGNALRDISKKLLP